MVETCSFYAESLTTSRYQNQHSTLREAAGRVVVECQVIAMSNCIWAKNKFWRHSSINIFERKLVHIKIHKMIRMHEFFLLAIDDLHILQKPCKSIAEEP